MRTKLVGLLRKVMSSSVDHTTAETEEYVVTVKGRDRGQKLMAIMQVEQTCNVRRWDWAWLGIRRYEATLVTVTYQGRTVYHRTFDYLVDWEVCADGAIAALEGDYQWLTENHS